jgi:hypothetical protein
MTNSTLTTADEQYLENRMDQLADAQMEEAERQGAEVFNLGWGQDMDAGRLESKTDQGILISQIEKDGSISHRWVA